MILEGKRALVTGGGVRLGRAIAIALAGEGADIAVHHHHSSEGAEETVEAITGLGRKAFALRGDLTSAREAAGVFEELDERFGGKLDVLVNSAGIFEKIAAEQIDDAHWSRMFAVNVESAFRCAKLARPRMIEAGGGSIVNVTDIAADRPWKGYAHYCASKAALVSLTKSLAIEWAPVIRVNAVSPGAVLPPDDTSDEEKRRLISTIPLGRLGDPADIGRTVAFLAGGPPYITGQVIAVDGGRSIRA